MKMSSKIPVRLPFDLTQQTSFFDDFCAVKNQSLDFLYEKLKASPKRQLIVEIDLIYTDAVVSRLELDSSGLYVGFVGSKKPCLVDSLGNEQIIQIASIVAQENEWFNNQKK